MSPGMGRPGGKRSTVGSYYCCGALQAGIDILVMRHPEAVKLVRKNIEALMVPNVVLKTQGGDDSCLV